MNSYDESTHSVAWSENIFKRAYERFHCVASVLFLSCNSVALLRVPRILFLRVGFDKLFEMYSNSNSVLAKELPMLLYNECDI